jgi:hypothetical protein
MSTWPPSQDFVVFVGSRLTVEFYYTEDPNIPALEFYEGRTEEEKLRFLHLAENLANGQKLPKTMFNIEDHENQIYALKPNQGRYLGFYTKDHRFVIANAFPKQTQKLGKREKAKLKVAIKAKHDYVRRTGQETYYERKKEKT